jgi:hypothetical protein
LDRDVAVSAAKGSPAVHSAAEGISKDCLAEVKAQQHPAEGEEAQQQQQQQQEPKQQAAQQEDAAA